MTFVSGDILYQSIAKIAASYNAMGALSIAAYDFENKFSAADINSIIIHDSITDSRAQEILNETIYATRDLTSVSSILYAILDDWDDNKLTSRDNRATTATGMLGANEFAQKFRPEWTTEAGAPSVGSGVLTLPADARVSISSTFNVGTWECLMVAVSGGDHSLLLESGGADVYECRRQHDATIGLLDSVGAAWVIGPNACQDETISSIIKMTRDGSSGWEIFEGGVSKGTATNSATTSFDKLCLRAIYQSSNFDNLKVY